MFSVLRTVFIVGLIFYYSPVRQAAPESGPLTALLNGIEGPATPAAETALEPPSRKPPSELDALWDALPESAKQSIVDRIVAAILGPAPDRRQEALLRQPTDTLEPEDFQPAWQGAAKGRPQS